MTPDGIPWPCVWLRVIQLCEAKWKQFGHHSLGLERKRCANEQILSIIFLYINIPIYSGSISSMHLCLGFEASSVKQRSEERKMVSLLAFLGPVLIGKSLAAVPFFDEPSPIFRFSFGIPNRQGVTAGCIAGLRMLRKGGFSFVFSGPQTVPLQLCGCPSQCPDSWHFRRRYSIWSSGSFAFSLSPACLQVQFPFLG